MMRLVVFVLMAGGVTCGCAQGLAPDRAPLSRRYQEGEQLAYRMKGINEGRSYELRAKGVVKRDGAGKFIEEYGWSDLIRNGSRGFASVERTLSPASLP